MYDKVWIKKTINRFIRLIVYILCYKHKIDLVLILLHFGNSYILLHFGTIMGIISLQFLQDQSCVFVIIFNIVKMFLTVKK